MTDTPTMPNQSTPTVSPSLAQFALALRQAMLKSPGMFILRNSGDHEKRQTVRYQEEEEDEPEVRYETEHLVFAIPGARYVAFVSVNLEQYQDDPAIVAKVKMGVNGLPSDIARDIAGALRWGDYAPRVWQVSLTEADRTPVSAFEALRTPSNQELPLETLAALRAPFHQVEFEGIHNELHTKLMFSDKLFTLSTLADIPGLVDAILTAWHNMEKSVFACLHHNIRDEIDELWLPIIVYQSENSWEQDDGLILPFPEDHSWPPVVSFVYRQSWWLAATKQPLISGIDGPDQPLAQIAQEYGAKTEKAYAAALADAEQARQLYYQKHHLWPEEGVKPGNFPVPYGESRHDKTMKEAAKQAKQKKTPGSKSKAKEKTPAGKRIRPAATAKRQPAAIANKRAGKKAA